MKNKATFSLAILFLITVTSKGIDAQFSYNGSAYYNLSQSFGFGTSSPNSTIDIAGTLRAGTSSGGLRLSDNGSTAMLQALTSSNSARDMIIKGQSLIFYTGTSYSEKMRINTNGNVGIGTTSPSSKLHLTGDFRHTASMISQGTNYATTWMRFKEHQHGNSLILGAGGLTAIGSGESSVQVNNNVGESSETLYLSSDNGLKILTNLQTGWGARIDALDITSNGNVGIGTSTPGNKLEVNGTIRSKEVIVEATGWPDFVFKSDYHLPDLSFVEAFIKEHGHLPNIPSQQQVEEQGQSLGETQKLLLQKIEELTLYVIELKKENEAQKSKNNELVKTVDVLSKKISELELETNND